VQVSQASADVQIERFMVAKVVIGLENRLSIRQEKDRRCVVLSIPKEYTATGRTHLSGLKAGDSHHQSYGRLSKNAKLRPVQCESGLIL
jgi:hypothetical protein